VVVLLEPAELVGDMISEALRQLTVPSGDHHVHESSCCPVVGSLARHVLLGGARPADLVFVPTPAC
jgi:hypothetical protein